MKSKTRRRLRIPNLLLVATSLLLQVCGGNGGNDQNVDSSPVYSIETLVQTGDGWETASLAEGSHRLDVSLRRVASQVLLDALKPG
jgi:hypothetical protein